MMQGCFLSLYMYAHTILYYVFKIQKYRSSFSLIPYFLALFLFYFFIECFQKTGLSSDIQLRLLHVFGAIMCGSQASEEKKIGPSNISMLHVKTQKVL